MTLIGRYLRREILGAVTFVLVGFLALFAFFDLIAELRDLGNGNYRLRQIFTVVALSLALPRLTSTSQIINCQRPSVGL